MKVRGAREKRWVVQEGDGATVADIVARAGEGTRAIEEGRVFKGRVRVKSGGESVRAGDEIRIGAGAGVGAGAAGSAGAAAWQVIWEKDGLLACDKPAGMPTVADHAGAAHALVALAAEKLGRKSDGLFVTSRLDREVSGVVVLAMSPKAEARLREARAAGKYTRRYVAIAAEAPGLVDSPEVGIWDAAIGGAKDARHRAALGPLAKDAVTRYAVVARAGGFVLLAVAPQTGRTHQIRVHASHAGAPLLGDRDYGGSARTTLAGGRIVALGRIALHAARVSVPAASGHPLVAEAPIPAELARAWRELGGAAEAWDRAVSCVLET